MIPPDFTRRVQENPQIAVELLKEAESAIRRLDWFLDMNPEHIDSTLNVIRQDLRGATLKAMLPCAAAHYTELSRQAAERTGEEVLAEHMPCIPGMES